LYLQRWDKHRHVLVVPPVILRKIENENINARFPFWKSFHNACPVQASALGSGEVLEMMVLHILRLRVSEELRSASEPLKLSLPFLEGSRIESHTFTFSNFKIFPKITSQAAGRGADDLKQMMDNPEQASYKTARPNALGQLAALLEEGIFYIPRPKSASSDLLFVTNNEQVVVEMQFKNGAQLVDSLMMSCELQKSCCFKASERSVVFVMIALTVDVENLPDGTDVFDSNNEKIAIRYHQQTAFSGFRVPSNLEVIIVLEPGLKSFLTDSNVEILRKSNLDLNDMAKATRSPSKCEAN